MRVVFLGSPEAVVPVLEKLAATSSGKWQLVGVVSQPARPVGRGGKLQDPLVAMRAKELGLDVLQPESARSEEFLAAFRAWCPDVAITAAYGQILSEDFLAVPKRGTINIHPSALPKYRGATPIQQALLDGESETAVSILFTVKKLDAGAIILQESALIEDDETAQDLMQRMFIRGADLLPAALSRLQDLQFQGEAQDETRVTHCRKIDKEDAWIDWTLPVKKICDRFRAYYPWPGTSTRFHDKRVIFHDLRVAKIDSSSGDQSLPLRLGEFLYVKPLKSLVIKGADGYLLSGTLQNEGGKVIDASSFWNGVKDKANAVFQ